MNKKMIRFSAFTLLLAMNTFAQAPTPKQLDEVVISDSKFALPKEKSGKVIVKINAEELAKKAGQSLATILSTVVGLEVNGNQSSTGKNLGYYVRGGRNRQTLILIDGIPVSDASGINLDYDLRLIPIEQVESIEVMKGAASTLYGSGAATGVINITLKKASKKEVTGNVYTSLGTQTTADNTNYRPQDFNQGFGLNGTIGKINYLATLNSVETKGISEAKGVDFEEDHFSRVNSLVKIGFTPNKKLNLDFFVKYDKFKNDFDSGSFADNSENFSISEQFNFGFSPKYKYENGEFIVNSSLNLIERKEFLYGGFTNYKSRNVNTDFFDKHKINSELFIVSGVQFQFYDMSISSQYTTITNELAKINMIDPYVSFVYNSKSGFNVNLGGRLNIHSDYGNHLVYNINPSYNFKNIPLKLISSFSTAYITPSLYQLYDGYAGNLNLKAEDNSTLEAGFEIKLLNNKLNFNSVAFYREEKNAIEYYSNPITYDSSYFNAEGKYNAKGVETTLVYKISDKLNFNANYTFNQVESKAVNNTFAETKANLYNPKHKVNASIDYQFANRAYFGINYQYLDKRDGFSGYPPQVFVLDSYQLLNTTIKYELIKNRFSIFGSVMNILNEDFEETVGYSTRGRNFKIGLNVMF